MNKLILIFLLLFGLAQAYGVDILRQHNDSQQEKSHWYDPIKSLFTQKVPAPNGRDIIVINKDKSISYNGQKLNLMDSIENWVKVLGKEYREDYYWDDIGISLSLNKFNQVDEITIQFLTYREIFPEKASHNFEDEGKGGILTSYFKGIIKIEDGYLAREISRDEFKKSDVWKKFKKDAFANSYWFRYKINDMKQFNTITFTHDGRSKRVSIY